MSYVERSAKADKELELVDKAIWLTRCVHYRTWKAYCNALHQQLAVHFNELT